MVVARIGVAAVAVLAAAGQGLLVVALDRAHAAGFEQRPDLLGVGSEAAEVTQAVERLGAARRRLLEQGAQGMVVVVDAAEHRDPGERPLDRCRVGAAAEILLDRPPALPGVQAAAMSLDRPAKLAEGDQLLAPGRHPPVGGQLGLGRFGGAAQLALLIFDQPLTHAQILKSGS